MASTTCSAEAGDQFLWVVTIAVSALLFMGYASAGEAVEDALVGISHSRWTYLPDDRIRNCRAILPAPPPYRRGNIHWTRQMDANLRKAATIILKRAQRAARLDIDGEAGEWPLAWLRPILAAGDHVRIPAETQPPLNTGGYIVSWQPDMDSLLGRWAKVTAVAGQGRCWRRRRPAQESAVDWLDRDPPQAPRPEAAERGGCREER